MRGYGCGWVYPTRVWAWRHGGAGRGRWQGRPMVGGAWPTQGSSTGVLPVGHRNAPMQGAVRYI